MEKKIRSRRSRLVISSDTEEGPEDTIPDLLVSNKLGGPGTTAGTRRGRRIGAPGTKKDQEELQAFTETQEDVQDTQPPSPFVSISLVNVEEQEPIEWDMPEETRASSIQQRTQQNSRQKRVPIRVKITNSKLPRISRVKSPVTAFPVGYDTNWKRKRKEEPERRASTGNRKRPHNPNRQLWMEDYVSGRPATPDTKDRPAWTISPPRFSNGRSEDPFPDLRQKIQDRKRSLPDLREKLGRKKQEAMNQDNRDRQQRTVRKSEDLDHAFDEQGICLKGCQFEGLKRISQNPDINPPRGVCFRCWKGNHKQFECPQKHQIPVNYCFNFGRFGLSLTTCKRRAEAHTQFLRQKALVTWQRGERRTQDQVAHRSRTSLNDSPEF